MIQVLLQHNTAVAAIFAAVVGACRQVGVVSRLGETRSTTTLLLHVAWAQPPVKVLNISLGALLYTWYLVAAAQAAAALLSILLYCAAVKRAR